MSLVIQENQFCKFCKGNIPLINKIVCLNCFVEIADYHQVIKPKKLRHEHPKVVEDFGDWIEAKLTCGCTINFYLDGEIEGQLEEWETNFFCGWHTDNGSDEYEYFIMEEIKQIVEDLNIDFLNNWSFGV
jgi:hypothetical protein